MNAKIIYCQRKRSLKRAWQTGRRYNERKDYILSEEAFIETH